MTYPAAIKFLHSLQVFGAKPGLGNPFKLAALAGNPQQELRFIHVAGTNGKGSTCAFLESIYRAAGLRVGLFTSPHLVAFGERIQVNRQLIPEANIARLAAKLKTWLANFPADDHPTFFEAVTIMGLLYFAEQKCDLVILETGLGGRLDATNIVTPLASVITNVQLDHQAWLGETLEQIATEKAGIIKPKTPVITAVDDAAAFKVISETAHRNESPLHAVTQRELERVPLKGLALPLLGQHQRLNAAVAIQTARALLGQIPVSDEIIRDGLQNVQWPGRLQLVKRPGGKKILLDGAHNIGGAESLRTALQTSFAATKPTLILGILGDKDCDEICNILAPLAARIILPPVKSLRTAAPGDLVAACRKANPQGEIRVAASLEEALELAKDDPFVVIAGSLYLIGEAMDLLRLAPETEIDERGLNEWSGKPSKQ